MSDENSDFCSSVSFTLGAKRLYRSDSTDTTSLTMVLADSFEASCAFSSSALA